MRSESSWSNLLRSFAWLCRCFLCVWQNRGQTLYLGLLFLAKPLMFLILFEHEPSESSFWFINLIVWTQRNNLELRPLFRKVHAQVFLLWIPPSTVQSVWRTPTCTTRLFRDTGKPMHLPLQGLGIVGSCGLHGIVGSAPCSYLNEVWGGLCLYLQTSPWLRNPSPASVAWGSLLRSDVDVGWVRLEPATGRCAARTYWPLAGLLS